MTTLPDRTAMEWSRDRMGRLTGRYGSRLSQTATKGTPPSNSLSVSTATNRVNGGRTTPAGSES